MSEIGSIVGGFSQGMATKKAGEAAADAAMANAMVQMLIARKTREDLAPWREAGGKAVTTLGGKVEAGPGEFTTSPGYEFRVQEGLNAIQQSAAGKGKLLSGQTLKGIEEFGQNIASNEYDNWLRQWYNSLVPYQNLAGLGGQISAQGAQIYGNYASQAGQAIGQAGLYNAAAMYGMGQTMGNTMTSMLSQQPMSIGSLGLASMGGLGIYG